MIDVLVCVFVRLKSLHFCAICSMRALLPRNFFLPTVFSPLVHSIYEMYSVSFSAQVFHFYYIFFSDSRYFFCYYCTNLHGVESYDVTGSIVAVHILQPSRHWSDGGRIRNEWWSVWRCFYYQMKWNVQSRQIVICFFTSFFTIGSAKIFIFICIMQMSVAADGKMQPFAPITNTTDRTFYKIMQM